MKTFNPYVKCLATMDERKAAWNTSRPDFKPGDLPFEEVERMDLSLNSMRVYTIEFRSSVLFRDLVFSLRPIQGWAQSTRSAPLERGKIRLSSEFSHMDEANSLIDKMMDLHEQGESRDKIRGLLTVNVSTVYTVTLDHRMVMGFCKSLKHLNLDLFNLYGRLILDAIDGWGEFDRSTVMPVHKFCLINDNERGEERTEKVGNMVFGYYNMKCALSAQFLRQHYSKIKIGYWSNVSNYFDEFISQSDKVEVVYYVDLDSYSRLMSMRSHWALDWSLDMWGSIIGDFIKDMTTEEFWDFLPNGNGKRDPYWADVYNRVLRKDPGIPCPIMCEWPDLIEKKELEVGKNPVSDMYYKLVEEGFIKDNPNNKYRKLYIESGEK